MTSIQCAHGRSTTETADIMRQKYQMFYFTLQDVQEPVTKKRKVDESEVNIYSYNVGFKSFRL